MSASAVHAVAGDLDAIGAALSASFAEDPVQQWLFEPVDDFDGSRTAFLRFFVDTYFPAGHVYVEAGTGGASGAAMWTPPDRDVLDVACIEALLALMDGILGDEALPRLSELARSGAYRPTEPHFYLGVLGIDPACQGKGLGAALVAPVLDACDQGGFVAHLESSNPRNLGFYERLGFVATDDFRCGGPAGPLMTIMRREPG